MFSVLDKMNFVPVGHERTQKQVEETKREHLVRLCVFSINVFLINVFNLCIQCEGLSKKYVNQELGETGKKSGKGIGVGIQPKKVIPFTQKIFLCPFFLPTNFCSSIYHETLRGNRASNFIKNETLAEVFSCKFCKMFQKTFFTEHLWTTAFVYHEALLIFH